MDREKKTITSEIVQAFLQCPRKAYFLLENKHQNVPNEYVKLLQQKCNNVKTQYIKLLKSLHSDIAYNISQIDNWQTNYIIDSSFQYQQYYFNCSILKKVQGKSRFGNYFYAPIIFAQSYTIGKPLRIKLCFISHILSLIQKNSLKYGYIIGLDGKEHRLLLKQNKKELIPVLEALQEYTNNYCTDEPTLILNKHCLYCQFERTCKNEAVKDDHLSLLDGISTQRTLDKYQKKGIFTVNQLSYLFHPRKRKKQRKQVIKHRVELQALALRTNKIYIQEMPNISRHSHELFLDFEGIPAERSYYLIGLLLKNNDSFNYFPFWANTPSEEEHIWHKFLDKIAEYPDASIYHYGNYDAKAIEQLSKRYATSYESIKERIINLNTYIYGKIYFPVHSNSLKEIGKYFGACWTSPQASGLKTLVWRNSWKETQDVIYRELLLTYNQEDCEALRMLLDKLSVIQQSSDVLDEIDFAYQTKKHFTKIGNMVHNEFQDILKYAHANYDQKKISFQDKNSHNEKIRYQKNIPISYKKIGCNITRQYNISPRKFCPYCKNSPLKHSNLVVQQVKVDFIVNKNGIKKSVTKYNSVKGWCKKCGCYYLPEEIRTIGRPQAYGHGLKSWVIYLRVGLRMPYNAIQELINEQFNHFISTGSISNFIREFGGYYVKTEQMMLQVLLSSPYICVDETPINVRGKKHYIWVFTNGRYVVFKYTETRESTIVHDLLGSYQGVLISDFYPGYDSLHCGQQKCWVHLIRELNEDLWKSPYDVEYEVFISEVRELIVPIMKAIQRYGLKKWHLNKFNKFVAQFYTKTIDDRYYRSELVTKYQKRFIRYKKNLFIFLNHDLIPWHNNIAENALRHITIQEKISGFFFKTLIKEYILLLGLRQTCRFYRLSFFKFLYSSNTKIDSFK